MNKFVICSSLLIVMLGPAGCSEARRDPCQLLTVEDVKSVDNTVVFSLWAGRDGERKEDEVCMFSTDDGDPRVMLFVWYDKEKDPKKLATKGAAGTGAMTIDLPGIGSKAAASFKERDSADFDEVVQLAEKALSRN